MSRKLIVAAAAAVAVNGLALADMGAAGQSDQSSQSSPSAQTGTAGQMGSSSQQQLTSDQFVKQAAIGNEFEIQSARLAEKNSNDPAVKQMAKDVRRDHEKAQDDLKHAAKKSNVSFSSTLDAQHQQKLDQLHGKAGDQFTQIYDQQQIQAHQNAVDLYQRAQTQLQDQDLKSYAQKTLPRLQEHLTMLQQHQRMAQGASQMPQAQPAGSSIPGRSDQNQPNQPSSDAQGNENPGTAGQGSSPGSDQNQGGMK